MKKTIITNLPQVYTVDVLDFNGQIYYGVGSEGEYPFYLIGLEESEMVKISNGPGGTMCMVIVPGDNKRLVSVMGLFPPFKGAEAAIYLHEERKGDWHTKKLIDLPFAHRCEILTVDNVNWLFAASVSVFKKYPEDWSLPGELYIIPLDQQGNLHDEPKKFINNVTRNHGMIKANLTGTEAIYISGKEGIFEIAPGFNSDWAMTVLFENEVSEFVFFDINDDEIKELITIEPFHGDTLKDLPVGFGVRSWTERWNL